MALAIGCIADDFTGATDLANTLVKQGLRTLQVLGVPEMPLPDPKAEAVVVALKSRTAPAAEAVAQSLAAWRWLAREGARQAFFKYCSTFDSTDAGNIGPVADALLDALGADFTIACPAFPTNGRTIYKGYLFVGDLLLSESGMKDHPLTPMRDASLLRVLSRQTPHRVGLVPLKVVEAGPEAIRAEFARLRSKGVRHAIVDAITDAHLLAIGAACRELALVTGGSGVALGLPENLRRAGIVAGGVPDFLPKTDGPAVVLSGSCSEATNAQVAAFRASGGLALALDPLELAESPAAIERAIAWARERLGARPLLLYSTAGAAEVAQVQARLGREKAGRLLERALADIAVALVAAGARRLVVAGGETSGAVVSALGIKALRIGPEIDPGVPWTASLGAPQLALALKSGNFGAPDFFTKAFEKLP